VSVFNLINQGFVNNLTVANQRVINAAELEGLASGIGSVLISGATAKLLIDLGAQRATGPFNYAFSSPSLSGITLRYGRELNSLTSASPSVTSSGITVNPTASGFSNPRYFELTHTTTSGSPVTASGIFISSDPSDINFGADGLLNTLTLTASGIGGYSPITEVKVMNSGTITTDIYVAVDTYNQNIELLENLEIAPTATGIFSSFDAQFEMPSGIPWQWGNFNNVSVVDDEIRLEEPSFSPPSFSLGQYYTLLSFSLDSQSPISRARLADGTPIFVLAGNNNQPILIDPIKNTATFGANPPSLPAANQALYQSFAWDGADRLYYMLNRSSNDRNIYYYTLSTNTHTILATTSFYVRVRRDIVFSNGFLYIYGGQTSVPISDFSGSSQFWRLNLQTLVFTQMMDAPVGFSSGASSIETMSGFIYLYSNVNFARYSIAAGTWQLVTLPPPISSYHSISAKTDTNEIWIFGSGGVVIVHSVTTAETQQVPILALDNSTDGSAIGIDNSMIYHYRTGFNIFRIYIIGQVPAPVINFTVSGTYTSPVFKLDTVTEYHRILIDYIKNGSAVIKKDANIGPDNFEIRGSDISPVAYNSVQIFDNFIDEEEFVVRSLVSQSVVGVLDRSLVFNHTYVSAAATPFLSAFITYGFPFITTGNMQYRFWWNPPTNKTALNTNLSRFYIVPFLSTLTTGSEPSRDSATLRRTDDDNIYIQLGQSADSGGQFTQLRFYKGDATVNYSINARSGTNYQIELLVNWNTGAYKLYFNSNLLGTGSIPLARLNLLQPAHTYEIHSFGQNISFDERFSYISVSRVGNSADTSDIPAVPVHRDDPLFGDAGSLNWFPVTVNSALIPKFKYVQFKMTLRGNNTFNLPVVQGIKFPKVLKLVNVSPGQTKSIYIRYKFPSVNNLNTDVIILRSWMFTDKV